MGALQCYRQILEEKSSATIQTSLKPFIMKVASPATDPVPATSAAPSLAQTHNLVVKTLDY